MTVSLTFRGRIFLKSSILQWGRRKSTCGAKAQCDAINQAAFVSPSKKKKAWAQFRERRWLILRRLLR